MPFSWAFVRPALLASGHKKTTELVDSPWFVLIKPTFVRLGCGKRGILIPPTVYALIFSRLSKFKVSYLVNVYAHVVTKQSDLCCKFSKKI